MRVVPEPLRRDPAPGPPLVASSQLTVDAPEPASGVAGWLASTADRLVPATGPAVPVSLVLDGHRPDGLPATVGVDPAGGEPGHDWYELDVTAGGIVLRAGSVSGLAGGAATLVQLLATAVAGEVPPGRIADAPALAWRGLSFDVARRYYEPADLHRLVDLLALYRCNVLQLHLTDDQGWRIGAGRPDPEAIGAAPGDDDRWYTDEELRALDRHAAGLGITIVPEVDVPGHTSALLRLRPELATGRNTVVRELVPGHEQHVAWLDPDHPATFAVVAEVLSAVAALFSGRFLHLGGDEPFGMPAELYAPFVRRARALVRDLGKVPVGWQESARAGLEPGAVVQHWIDGAVAGGVASPDDLPEGVRRLIEEITGTAAADLAAAVAADARLLLSPTSQCYLDTRYAGPAADDEEEGRRRRLGLPFYPRRTVEAFWDWDPLAGAGLAEAAGFEPARHLAGVSAALWSESIGDFDDACFLLLPRLPGVADRAWNAGRPRTWSSHRERLAAHAPLWRSLGLPWFRGTEVPWR